jgi:hypothetical protein
MNEWDDLLDRHRRLVMEEDRIWAHAYDDKYGQPRLPQYWQKKADAIREEMAEIDTAIGALGSVR